MEDDEFKTFIPQKETSEKPLDLQSLMLSICKHPDFNFSTTDFWKMPLFLVLQLLGIFESPTKKPMSRKTLIDQERRWNLTNGY